jgi:ATP-dependent DNA ligase
MRSLAELKAQATDLGISFEEKGKSQLMDQIAAARGFLSGALEQIFPQLAKDSEDLSEEEKREIIKSDKWVCGEKKNGVRGICHVFKGVNRFTSRNRCAETYLLHELTDNLPYLSALDLSPWQGSIFDGELYVKDDFIQINKPASALEGTSAILNCGPEKAKALQDIKGNDLRYFIFDVIKDKGRDIRALPLKERQKVLREFKRFVEAEGYGGFIEFEDLIYQNKEEYYKKIIEDGGEGIVLKDLNAPYFSGVRSRAWIKVKKSSTTDAIIIGFGKGKEWDKRGFIGSLELGVYDECGDLRSLGRVSSFPLGKRMTMTELDKGTPVLKKEYLGQVVECRFQELNKNLKARHLHILAFRTGASAKPLDECVYNFSRDKEKLRQAGIPIPEPLENPPIF